MESTFTSDRKILIIDDEEEIGFILKRILRKKFSSIDLALNLKNGLERAIESQPDILLLDNNLPDGSGIEQISLFRKAIPNACIIIISAMTHLAPLALEKGAYAFLEKPLSSEKIMDTIDQACKNKRTI